MTTPASLVQQLEWRYATKHFDPAKRIPAGTWDALEKSLVLSPSSFGLQPWRFVVVSDPAIRQKLQAVSWNQPQITEASHLVVFAHRTGLTNADVARLLKQTAQTRGVPVESLDGYRKMIEGFVAQMGQAGVLDAWTARQTYIALGTFLTSAAMLGVDACPMEGIDAAAYDQILGLAPLGYHTLCVATAGTRAADDAYASLKKVRYAADEVIGRA